MTFRSAAGPWNPYPAQGNQQGFCLDNVPLKSIQLIGTMKDPNHPAAPNAPFPPLNKDWTMTLNGRSYSDSTQPSSYGTEIDARHVACDDRSAGTSLRLLAIQGGMTSFYPIHDAANDDMKQTHSVRFADPEPQCEGPAGGGSGDEDACERASLIVLTLDPSDVTGTPFYYRCTNGECEIDVD